MSSMMHSQNILKKDRVKIHIDKYGDTLTTMSLSDAKKLYKFSLLYDYNLKLNKKYKERNLLLESIIKDCEMTIDVLIEKNNNLNYINKNVMTIIKNKDEEIRVYNEIIKEKNKEIKRQKTKKVLGFVGSAVLIIGIVVVSG